jgi:hypothetical protein
VVIEVDRFLHGGTLQIGWDFPNPEYN